MRCECGGKLKVIDTRHRPIIDVWYRRRRCRQCGRFLVTYEIPKKLLMTKLDRNTLKQLRKVVSTVYTAYKEKPGEESNRRDTHQRR